MSETANQALRRTPLDALHRRRGAKMVPFAGFEMPLQFAGIVEEHRHVRAKAGLFDVSHMGQARLKGEDAARALEALVPGDVVGLAAGRTRYTVLTNAAGGILDDLMVTKATDHLYLVVNASRAEADFAHMAAALAPGAALEPIADRALLALQGPAAAEVLARFAPPSRHLLFMGAETLTVANVPCLVNRSGYTGEDGFEISVPANEVERLAELLLAEPEVAPIGLGARDTLRLEAGLCLYGNDINETTTPVEADLAWTIGKRRRIEGGFLGADTILKQLREGPPRLRVGIRPTGRQPARQGTPVVDAAGHPIGTLTSGGFGPSVEGPIAMGYVERGHATPGTAVGLMVRGRRLEAEVVKLPFVQHRYVKH